MWANKWHLHSLLSNKLSLGVTQNICKTMVGPLKKANKLQKLLKWSEQILVLAFVIECPWHISA